MIKLTIDPFKGIAYAIPFFFASISIKMSIIISPEMKFNIAKSIVVKLFNQKLITIDEFSIIINKLASTYGITSDIRKSND